MKTFTNKKGMTLVESLAVLVIISTFFVLLCTVLTTFFQTEKNVTANTLLRDEADYLMSNFINTIYTLKESEVCGDLITWNDPDNPHSYIKTMDANGKCTNNSPITGFYSINKKVALYIKGEKLDLQNEGIQIDPSSKLEKQENVYKITLTLQYDGKSKTFFSEIHSIQDIE